jgi:hypothetical protein
MALISTLPLVYNTVSLIFDEFWSPLGEDHKNCEGRTKQVESGRVGK